MVHPPPFTIQACNTQCRRTSTKDINMSLLTGLLLTWLMTTRSADWTIIWLSLERSTSKEKIVMGQHELTFLFLQPRGFCMNLD